MSIEDSNPVEQLIDERMNALVESYLGNPDGIPKQKIQEQLEAAFKDAHSQGLISDTELQDLTHREEIMESIPQEARVEIENTGKEFVPKVHPSVIKEYQNSIAVFESSGFPEAAEDMRKKMMENCYQEVGTGKINEIAQPDKIVGTGKFKPSKLDNAVDKVMEGKETISVPKFKETVWQKIKNALHIGKGHEARKQEHVQKFAKDSIKSGIPKDVLDKAKSIGAKAQSSSISSPPKQTHKNQVGRKTGGGRRV